MEIEAKYTLDDDTFGRLSSVSAIASFVLLGGIKKSIVDIYLDTPDRAILGAGYACRQRSRRDKAGVRITLKGLGTAAGAIHRRDELEVVVDDMLPPAQWPDGPARDLVLDHVGDQALDTLLEIRQERLVRRMLCGDRPVAELSLDCWQIGGDDATRCSELEVELLPDGTEEELRAVTRELEDLWALTPEPQSKLQRALQIVQQRDGHGELLTPWHRAACARIAARADLYGRRARALLAVDQGMTQEQAGEHSGLSPRRVRHWAASFRQRQLEVFPSRVLAELDHVLPVTEVTHPAQVAPANVKAQPPESSPPQDLASSKAPGLDPDDLMIEAVHKTLRFHYGRMIKHEPGTRAGDDIEELHDMRVATRRMRAAFRVYGEYLDAKTVSPYIRGMRRTGRALGAVRDLDVFWEKTDRYLASLPPGAYGDLSALHAAWQAERARARERMIAYLDSDRYLSFREAFAGFLDTTDAGALPIIGEDEEPRPHRLRFVAPVLIHDRLSAVMAYDGWVTGSGVPLERLHSLRIAAKALRYTLEFLEEVLGSGARPVINGIKALQDHLGDLHDAIVASGLLRDFLVWGTWGPRSGGKKSSIPLEPIIAPGVAAYLAHRQAELQSLLEGFPEAWAAIRDPAFRRAVAATTDSL